ncbi:hypothetical protein ET495_14885 [Xylanimonas allomyrinae]|uniref:Uncharacterized protein n=1 Tax=Xylanimonas allomyrinae TaxID=2509459 RepID=A0A4P6EUZ2_9MICO|nr:hypothetical protein [Xylanimonas allomyrinae]QAY64277.1 hypothetical protein ET495_14885 [Xylanimonas allomyrinae]
MVIDQPRRPRGTPTGGQWDRGASGGAAAELDGGGDARAREIDQYNARAGGSFVIPPVPRDAEQHYNYFFTHARVPDDVVLTVASAFARRREAEIDAAYREAYDAHNGDRRTDPARTAMGRRKEHARTCPYDSAEDCGLAAAQANEDASPGASPRPTGERSSLPSGAQSRRTDSARRSTLACWSSRS